MSVEGLRVNILAGVMRALSFSGRQEIYVLLMQILSVPRLEEGRDAKK